MNERALKNIRKDLKVKGIKALILLGFLNSLNVILKVLLFNIYISFKENVKV